MSTKKVQNDLTKLYAPPKTVELAEGLEFTFNTITAKEIAQIKGPMNLMELLEAIDNLDMSVLSPIYWAGAKKAHPDLPRDFFDGLTWAMVVKLQGIPEFILTYDAIIDTLSGKAEEEELKASNLKNAVEAAKKKAEADGFKASPEVQKLLDDIENDKLKN